MAALQALVNIPSIALVAATAKTVVQLIAPTNQRLKVLEIGVTFDGTSNTAQPIECKIIRQTTAGTVTATTPQFVEPELTETVQATAGLNATVEPTYAANALQTMTIHPQAGVIYPLPFGQELIVGGGGRLGLVLTAPANVNVRGWIRYEE